MTKIILKKMKNLIEFMIGHFHVYDIFIYIFVKNYELYTFSNYFIYKCKYIIIQLVKQIIISCKFYILSVNYSFYISLILEY